MQNYQKWHGNINPETAINHREHRGNILIVKEEFTVFNDFLCALFYARVKLIIFQKYKKRTQRITWK